MKVLSRWRKSLYKRFLRMRLIPPKVILNMDGGVSSQIHQYLLGQLYAEKGYRVRYDLSFFHEWGSDLNNQFARNFDLLKAFPYLKFKKASSTAIQVYKRNFFILGNNTGERIEDFGFLDKKPPVYLGGYYHLPAAVWLPAFQRLYRMENGVLDNVNAKLCEEIISRPYSIGVHVRRGDLKIEMFDYGKPASLAYFAKAVSFFQEKNQNAYFYFFSDEPEWVADVLTPSFHLVNNFTIVDLNGSDKGYMDLFLMSRCQHQITSKGTLGKYAALLTDNVEKQVVLCDDEIEYSWKELLHNPVFI